MKKVFNFITLILFLYLVLLSFFDYVLPPFLIILAVFLIVGQFVHYIFIQGKVLYVLKRIIGAFLTLFVVASTTFLILRLLPGGPFDEDKVLPPKIKANIESKYKLNEPIYKQYYYYFEGLFKGDLGESYKYIGRSVSDILSESFPASLQVGLYALIIAFTIGIPSGLIAASRYNTLTDRSLMFFAISGISLPSFLLAACFILFFSFVINLFPPALWEGPEYYVLPMFSLGIRPAALLARLTRSSVLDVVSSDYIRTAYAKGLSRAQILYKHVLKNSLLPVLTSSGPLIAGILTGSFVIELIFAIPGMGKHFVQGVTNRDYPLILGLTLLYSVLLIIANLVVDLLYSYFDPRIKLE